MSAPHAVWFTLIQPRWKAGDGGGMLKLSVCAVDQGFGDVELPNELTSPLPRSKAGPSCPYMGRFGCRILHGEYHSGLSFGASPSAQQRNASLELRQKRAPSMQQAVSCVSGSPAVSCVHAMVRARGSGCCCPTSGPVSIYLDGLWGYFHTVYTRYNMRLHK